ADEAAFFFRLLRRVLLAGIVLGGGLLLRRGLLLFTLGDLALVGVGGLLRRGLPGRLLGFLGLGLGLVVGEQLVLGHLLVGDRGHAEQMVGHLRLERRRADRGGRAGVGAVIFVDLLLLALRDAAELLEQRALKLVVRDLDPGLLADVGKDEAETDAALGEPLILDAGLGLGRLLVLEGAAGAGEVGVDLRPDIVELGLDQLGRRLELVGLVERVEQLALGLLAGDGAVLALDLAAHDLAQLLRAFEPELLGDLVVDLQLAGLGHFLG